MKIWINGAEGFIGGYLFNELKSPENCVIRTSHKKPKNNELLKCDVNSEEDIKNILLHEPEIVFHLAAQSYVTVSWKDPKSTFLTNVIGTKNLFESIRKSRLDPVVFVAGSSAEYGDVTKDKIPIKESQELNPVSPYGISKVGEEMIANMYYKVYGIKSVRMRFFNITGPGKVNDANSDFARKIIDIENNKKKYLDVGNLKKIRDITDVRDLINALTILIKKAKCNEVYNICSGVGTKIKDVLDTYISLANRNIMVREISNLKRDHDENIYIGDNKKIHDLGWKQKIPLKKTLEDTLKYWRSII